MKTPQTNNKKKHQQKPRGLGIFLWASPTVKTTGKSTPRTIHTLTFFSKEEAPGGEKNQSIFSCAKMGCIFTLVVSSNLYMKCYVLFIGKKGQPIILLDTQPDVFEHQTTPRLKNSIRNHRSPKNSQLSPKMESWDVYIKPSK